MSAIGDIATLIVVTMVLISSLTVVWRSWRTHLRLRRSLRGMSPAPIQRSSVPQPPVRTLIFRSRLGWIRGILLFLSMAIVTGLGLTWIGLLWWTRKSVGIPLLLAAMLVLCFWLVLRDVGVRIIVSPTSLSLKAWGRRRVEIPWDEIVFLSAVPMEGLDRTVYRVYSPTRTISFQDTFPDTPRLLEMIARATGLEWHEG